MTKLHTESLHTMKESDLCKIEKIAKISKKALCTYEVYKVLKNGNTLLFARFLSKRRIYNDLLSMLLSNPEKEAIGIYERFLDKKLEKLI